MRTTKPLLHRLGKRYGVVLEDPVKDNVTQIRPEIILVSQADDLLKVTKGQETTGTATARTDTYAVPSGKRWRLVSAVASRANAEAINFYARLNGTSYFFDRAGATTTIHAANFNPVTVDENDAVIIEFATGVSGSLTSTIIYEEEDAF